MSPKFTREAWDAAFPTLPTGEPDIDAMRESTKAEVIADMGQEWYDKYGEASFQAALAQLGMLGIEPAT